MEIGNNVSSSERGQYFDPVRDSLTGGGGSEGLNPQGNAPQGNPHQYTQGYNPLLQRYAPSRYDTDYLADHIENCKKYSWATKLEQTGLRLLDIKNRPEHLQRLSKIYREVSIDNPLLFDGKP